MSEDLFDTIDNSENNIPETPETVEAEAMEIARPLQLYRRVQYGHGNTD